MSTSAETSPRRVSEIELACHDLARLSKSPEETPLRESFHEICQIAANTLEVERVGIWLFTSDRKAIRCASLYERSTKIFSEGMTFNVADFPDHFDSLNERISIDPDGTIQSPCSVAMKLAYHDPLGITSMIDAPIIVEGKLIGCVCHEHVGGTRKWLSKEREFAKKVAATVAAKLNGLSLYDAWQKLRTDGTSPMDDRIREITAQISAGVAHDFRNLLQIVIGNAQLIAHDPDATPKMIERTKQILQAADRGAHLATELTAIGKFQAGQPRVVSAADAVSNFLPLLRSSVGPTHAIDFQKVGNDAKVFIDPMQLERIVMNLVMNAREASPRGGPINIAVEGRSREHPESVLLSVSDKGSGIDTRHLNRIFDPFFTTKQRGKGSGFGLSIVKRFVELAGGTINVKSAIGAGTTVCCALPRASFVG